MLTSLKCESASRRFQPGEGPSRGLLCDCTTSPMDRFAALDEARGHILLMTAEAPSPQYLSSLY